MGTCSLGGWGLRSLSVAAYVSRSKATCCHTYDLAGRQVQGNADPLFTCRWGQLLTSPRLKDCLRMSASPFWKSLWKMFVMSWLVKLSLP